MSNIFKNWKTTSAGLIMIVGAIAMYINDKTKLMEAITSVLGGIGLLYAADHDLPTQEDTK